MWVCLSWIIIRLFFIMSSFKHWAQSHTRTNSYNVPGRSERSVTQETGNIFWSCTSAKSNIGFLGSSITYVADCCPVCLRSAPSHWSELTGTSKAAELLDLNILTGRPSRFSATYTGLHALVHKQKILQLLQGYSK